jgi:uncharacterized protein with HEPN domain
MSRHNDQVPLQHMIDYIKQGIALSADKSRDDLDTNVLFELAMVRVVEVIGEAAARVSDEFQGQHPEIPWRQIIGVRNRLIHGYDQIHKDVLWKILKSDLPELLPKIERTLE